MMRQRHCVFCEIAAHREPAEIIYETLTADPRFFRAAREALAE